MTGRPIKRNCQRGWVESWKWISNSAVFPNLSKNVACLEIPKDQVGRHCPTLLMLISFRNGNIRWLSIHCSTAVFPATKLNDYLCTGASSLKNPKWGHGTGTGSYSVLWDKICCNYDFHLLPFVWHTFIQTLTCGVDFFLIIGRHL